MHSIANRLIFSATDLSQFLGCPHLTLLSRRAALGGPKPPKYDDPGLEVLWQRGLHHEQQHLAGYRDAGKRIVELADVHNEADLAERWAANASATREAMHNGADVIYQATLFDGTWLGKADFLIRVDTPSQLGNWSYEVVDTKLAREAKGGALLQVLLYADLLEKVQGIPPEHVRIALGGPEPRTEAFRVADYAAYFRSVKQRFLQLMQSEPAEIAIAPDPVEHCHICAWSKVCADERRSVDHLALVAGITSNQRRVLRERGIDRLESLATIALPIEPRIQRLSTAGVERIQKQAAIQLQGRQSRSHVHELLRPITAKQGLAKLPEPSNGDLFFDIEGDPFALTYGLEYLFGLVDRDGIYTASWALTRDEERRLFEEFMDFVMARLERYPDLHIFHYNHYETTALKRLMGRHGTREDEVDRLLRGGVFIDLYRVVKQGLRASVESYSIKKLEPFYGYQRDVDLRSASNALAHFEAWLELGGQRDDELLTQIQGYNRDDCISTLRLHDWLERLRHEQIALGEVIERPSPESGDPSEELAKRDEIVDALVAQLTHDVPADEHARTPEQQARWLAAQLLGFHRREKKAFWWEFFRTMDLSDDELIEDEETLGGLQYEGNVGEVKRSYLHAYSFPPQDHGMKEGKGVIDPATKKGAGEIVDVDDPARRIVLKRDRKSDIPQPRALVLNNDVPDKVLRESVLRVGQAIMTHGFGATHPYCCAVDLLLRTPVADSSVEPIQGPPGAGKTHTAARMIVEALQKGQKVGVTAQSHKVIGNLLDEVCRAAAEAGVTVRGIQRADEEQRCNAAEIEIGSNANVLAALQSGAAQLAAGTAWLWSRDDMIGSVDVLFIDEAGQFSLASAVAVAPAARRLVLVGDPRQLEQPIQGVHPPGVEVSALDHLLGGAATVTQERGTFLDQTWRLHPDICAFTSEIFYDGRLHSRAGLERQVVGANGRLHGSGLRFIAVPHAGNRNESPEEVGIVRTLFDELLDGASYWIDKHGDRRPLQLSDILVVAPYNAHVSALAKELPAGARVGTVDKFQGQEAPVVIYSMATSSSAEAPRGMEFLYSPNRLNVATSRARCLAVVVASPELFAPECRTPQQMRLANAFCRFAELAEVVDVPVA